MSFKKLAYYRLSTILQFAQLFIWVFVDLIFFKSVFANVDSFAGWNYWDAVLLVFSLSLFWDIFWRVTSGGIAYIPEKIFSGNINQYLLKPINPLFSLAISEVGILDNSLNTPILFIYFVANQGFHFSFVQIIGYLVMMLIGVGIFSWLLIIIVSLSFWSNNVDNLSQVYWDLQNLAKYPKDIFTGFVGNLFMFVIPVFFIANLPTDVLRHGVNFNYILLGILLNIILAVVGINVWRYGLKMFKGTSM